MDQTPLPPMTEMRLLVANACRVLGTAGLAEDVLGHISVRTGADRILIRCRGPEEAGLFLTQTADVREVDLDGKFVDGGLDGWNVPNELPIHAEVLRARPDVDAVVHCHPPSVLMAGLEGVPLRPVFGAYNLPAARLALGGVPVYPRSVLIRRPELGRAVAEALGNAPVLIMRGHGITAVGSGPHAVEQAVLRAVALDVLARVSLDSARLGGKAAELPPEDVAELPDLGETFNQSMLFRYHLARLRHEGLLLES